MPERCLPCRYNEDGTRNYRYSDEGIDLLAEITLNINPLDIDAPDQKSVNETIRKWNGFISFVRGKINIFETKFNADSSINNLQELLNNYNADKSELGKITINDIKKAQIYHQIADPDVVIDGRLGTQTFKLIYPEPIIWENKKETERNGKWIVLRNQTPEYGYLPVSWGDKKYVLSSRIYNQFFLTPEERKNAISPSSNKNREDGKSIYELIEPYKPSIHNNVLFYKEKDPNESWPNWGRLDLAYTPRPTPTPTQINLVTKKDQFKKEVTQKTTNLLNQIK